MPASNKWQTTTAQMPAFTNGPFKAIQIQNRQHDYWHGWVRSRHPSRDFDTVDVRHRKVEDQAEAHASGYLRRVANCELSAAELEERPFCVTDIKRSQRITSYATTLSVDMHRC